jgi:hypothetical protein
VPVERGLGLDDLRRERRELGSLRRCDRAAGQEVGQRSRERLRRERREPFVERGRRVLAVDRRRAHEVDGAGVEACVHLHHTDARRGVTREHGALNRRRAAPARQDRSVQVDAAQARPFE